MHRLLPVLALALANCSTSRYQELEDRSVATGRFESREFYIASANDAIGRHHPSIDLSRFEEPQVDRRVGFATLSAGSQVMVSYTREVDSQPGSRAGLVEFVLVELKRNGEVIDHDRFETMVWITQWGVPTAGNDGIGK